MAGVRRRVGQRVDSSPQDDTASAGIGRLTYIMMMYNVPNALRRESLGKRCTACSYIPVPQPDTQTLHK